MTATTVTKIDVAPAATRAGDREREATAAQLGLALAQGYLDLVEYEDRAQAAYGAHDTGELARLLDDLPVDRLKRADPRRRAARQAADRRSVRIHLAAYLLMAVVVVTVWLASALTAGGWYFWPVWPILGAGIGLVSHAIPVGIATSRPVRA